MVWTRRLLAILLALTVFGAACSSDDDSAAEDGTDESSEESTDTEETTDDAADDAAEESTDDAADSGEEAAEDDGEEAAEAPADGVSVELGEWFVDTEATQEAGTVTFAVSNVGENPHAFAIVRGNSYEELPQLDNGAVDTDAMGDDFLDSTDNIEVGESTEIAFDLEPGNYVFFCPIQFGPNSHAAAGQVLSVTVG